MSEDKYIQSLENLLIYMCKTYDLNIKVLKDLVKEDNDALFKIYTVQGTSNIIAISKIAQVEFEQPIHNFKEVKEEIIKRRKNRIGD